MVRPFVQKNTGDTLIANEWNESAIQEVVNLISNSNISPSGSDVLQLSKALVRIIGGSHNVNYYDCLNNDPVYELSLRDSFASIGAFGGYRDGLEVKFKSNFTSDGVSQTFINVEGLGNVPIEDTNSGFVIPVGAIVHAVYDTSAFRVMGLVETGVGGVSLVNNILRSQIGEKLFVDRDNTIFPVNQSIVQHGSFEYLLCNGQSFLPSKYPDLALHYPNNIVPNYDTHVLRHRNTVASGGPSVPLARGYLQSDSIKTHTINVKSFKPLLNSFNVSFDFLTRKTNNDTNVVYGGKNTSSANADGVFASQVTTTTPQVTRKTKISYNKTFTPTSKTVSGVKGSYTGEVETRMRNVTGQFYVKAKVIL